MSTKKRKPGRPLKGKERVKRYQVVLEPRDAEWLRKLGNGNLSAGIVAAKVKAELEIASYPKELKKVFGYEKL